MSKKPRKETEEAMKEARKRHYAALNAAAKNKDSARAWNQEMQRKPPVKMRAVGWAVLGHAGDVRYKSDEYEDANHVAYMCGGKVVRLYVRSDK